MKKIVLNIFLLISFVMATACQKVDSQSQQSESKSSDVKMEPSMMSSKDAAMMSSKNAMVASSKEKPKADVSVELTPEDQLPELLELLKSGNNLIVFRHAQKIDNGPDAGTARLSYDISEAALKSPIKVPAQYAEAGGMCLTQLGKSTAWILGEVFKRLKIPVSRIVASPICRCQQMAKIMFGTKVETAAYLAYDSVFLKEHYKTANIKKAELFEQIPKDGTNLVIIAHGKTAKEAGVTETIPKQGSALIIRKDKSGKFVVKGHVNPQRIMRFLPQRKKF